MGFGQRLRTLGFQFRLWLEVLWRHWRILWRCWRALWKILWKKQSSGEDVGEAGALLGSQLTLEAGLGLWEYPSISSVSWGCCQGLAFLTEQMWVLRKTGSQLSSLWNQASLSWIWPIFGVGMGLELSWVLTLLTLGKGKSELDLDHLCPWNRYRSGAKLGPSHPHLGESYNIRMQVARKTLVTPSQGNGMRLGTPFALPLSVATGAGLDRVLTTLTLGTRTCRECQDPHCPNLRNRQVRFFSCSLDNVSVVGVTETISFNFKKFG